MHQWSISLLGVCDPLYWRTTVEPMVANGSLELLVTGDLDLVITPSGRASARPCARTSQRPRPGLWQHQFRIPHFLSHGSGHVRHQPRNGDVLGTIRSALVLATRDTPIATSGPLMTGRSSYGPSPLSLDNVP